MGEAEARSQQDKTPARTPLFAKIMTLVGVCVIAWFVFAIIKAGSAPSFFSQERKTRPRAAPTYCRHQRSLRTRQLCDGGRWPRDRADYAQKPTQAECLAIKSVVEKFLEENHAPRYTHVGVFGKQDGFPITMINLDVSRGAVQATKSPAKADGTDEGTAHFRSEGIAFDYPPSLHVPPNTVFDPERVRAMQEQSGALGIETLGALMSADGQAALQLARTKRTISFDTLFREKQELAMQINSVGVSVMGDQFTKFSVEKTVLGGDIQAICGYGEKANGEVAVTYEFVRAGYDYALMFLHKSKNLAADAATVRDRVVKSVRLDQK